MTRFVKENGKWSNGGMWGYGYQWWSGRRPNGRRIVAGIGNGYQRLFILPEERLVVTMFAGEYDRFDLRRLGQGSNRWVERRSPGHVRVPSGLA